MEDGYDNGLMADYVDELEKEVATLREQVKELKRIIVGQCGVITELRIKLASDAIKQFAGEANQ